MDLLIDDGEKVIPMSRHKKISKQKVWRCTEKKYDPAFCVRTSMANYRNENNRLVNLPLYCITNWIWCDIKKFLKISKMAGRKNLTSARGRKLRFCQYIVLTKSAWWWNIPTPLFNFKIVALKKNIKFKFQNNWKSVNPWLAFFI